MLAKVLIGIAIYGALLLFLFWLARMSIRREMSQHPDPPYRVAHPFVIAVYSIFAFTYVLITTLGIVVFHIP